MVKLATAELLAGHPLVVGDVCEVVINDLRFRGVVIAVDWGGERVVVKFAGGKREQFYRTGECWCKVGFAT